MRRRSFLLFSAAGFTGMGIAAGYNWWMTRRLLIGLKLISPPANLLRNSDFSMCTNPNVPDYWGTTAPGKIPEWHDLLHITRDAPLYGASVVRVHNPKQGYLMSLLSYGAFVPENQPYTFSVYLRSDIDEFPAALAIGWGEQKQVSVGTRWQRYSTTYSPAGEAVYRYAMPVRVSLLSEGSLWMATPQLEKGERATEFSLALMDDHPLPVAEVSREEHDFSPGEMVKTLADVSGTVLARPQEYTGSQRSQVIPTRTSGHAGSQSSKVILTETRGHAGSVRPQGGTLRAIAITETEDWCLDDIASHGFNAVSIFVPTSNAVGRVAELKRVRDRFDAAARRGLQVVPILEHRKNARFVQLRGAVTDTIDALKDHPAIAAWMLLDEPGRWWANTGADERRVTELYRAAKQSDPSRAVFINDNVWAPGKGGYGSLEASDIGCNDLYPIGQYRNAVQLVADRCATIGRDCIAAGKPAAFWLQMYGYDDAVREPTPGEEHAMTYLAYIAGVRLLFYWIYKPMNTALWEGMKPLGDEIELLDQTLSHDDVRCARIGTAGLRTHFAFWEGKDACYLAVCNASDERATAKFDLAKLSSRRLSRRREWYGLDGSGVGNELTLSLDGYQREVMELW